MIQWVVDITKKWGPGYLPAHPPPPVNLKELTFSLKFGQSLRLWSWRFLYTVVVSWNKGLGELKYAANGGLGTWKESLKTESYCTHQDPLLMQVPTPEVWLVSVYPWPRFRNKNKSVKSKLCFSYSLNLQQKPEMGTQCTIRLHDEKEMLPLLKHLEEEEAIASMKQNQMTSKCKYESHMWHVTAKGTLGPSAAVFSSQEVQ